MSEVVIDQFTNSGSEYRFIRNERGDFCITKDGKITYKGFNLKHSRKQYDEFKRQVMRGGENG